MALGKRIRDIRLARGIDQQAISNAIEGLSQQALSNLENRDSETSVFALRIADALGVSVRWLLDGVGEPEDSDWPFPRVKRDRWAALKDPADRAYVQGAINAALADCEKPAKQTGVTVMSTSLADDSAVQLHSPSKGYAA